MGRILLIFCLSFILVSCQEDSNNSSLNNVTSVQEFLNSSGGFRISFMIEEGVNKTNQFSPYLFVFGQNGTVTASSSSGVFTGSYLVFTDDNRVELRMNFPVAGILFELTDDWYYISKTGESIRFEDSGDIVEFQKQG